MQRSARNELAAQAKALRGLASALVGDQHADDLVQDAALQALRERAVPPTSLRAWLGRVLRHLAGKHHRTLRRRQQHESRAQQPTEPLPPDRIVEHRDLLLRVTSALLALPEPYQKTLLQRFFEDLPPAAIAARTGEPLATIKSRLQRGLALLRERLDRDGRGGEWRAVLGPAFGLGRLLPEGTAAPVGTTGVVLMGMGSKVMFCGAAAIVAVMTLLWSTSDEQAGSPPTNEVPTAAAATAIAGERATLAATEEPRRELRSPSEGDPGPAADTFLRGRCIDERGLPLAAAKITLQGKPRADRNTEFTSELRTWRAAYPGFLWQDRQVATSADGRFELALPWSPHWFEVVLQRDAGAVPLTSRLGVLRRGETRDLGDLPLPIACSLRGRIVDTEGAPAVAGWLNVLDEDDSAPRVLNAPFYRPLVRPDGSFTLQIIAGSYRFMVFGHAIQSGRDLVVPPLTAALEAKIVIAAPSAALTITGTVVDGRGLPLSGVPVYGLGNEVGLARTDASGAFVLARAPDDKRTDTELKVWHEGFAPYASATRVRWGSRDHRITLDAGLAIEVHVTEAANGRPVEDFALHVRGQREDPVYYINEDAAYETGDHHGSGIVRVSGLARGDHLLTVVPVRGDLMASLCVPVTVSGPDPLRIDVGLQPGGCRLLRVRFADGAPAPGTKIELIDPVGADLTLQTAAVASGDWNPGEPRALRLQSGTTDAGGELLLHGARERRVALRLHGAGHPPHLVTGVALDVGEPLSVTLPRGARLEGTLGPPALVRELRAACGLGDRAAPVKRGVALPGFRLQRGDGALLELLPAKKDAPVLVAEDGAFTIDHVPEGTWHLALEPWSFDRPGRRGVAEPVATVTLRDGETSTVAVALPGWLPATVEGQVVKNGEAWAERTAALVVRHTDVLGRPQWRWEQVRTDRGGRFSVRTREGHVRVSLTQSRGETWHTMRTVPEVFAAAGQVTSAVFAIDSGKLRLRLVGEDGVPVTGVPLVLVGDARSEAASVRARTAASDAEGRIECEVDGGELSVQVLPQRLQSPEAQTRLMYKAPEGSTDSLRSHRLSLGTVTGRRGETVEVDLRLPAEWYR